MWVLRVLGVDLQLVTEVCLGWWCTGIGVKGKNCSEAEFITKGKKSLQL